MFQLPAEKILMELLFHILHNIFPTIADCYFLLVSNLSSKPVSWMLTWEEWGAFGFYPSQVLSGLLTRYCDIISGKTFFLVTCNLENIDTGICSRGSRDSLSGYHFYEAYQVDVSVQMNNILTLN